MEKNRRNNLKREEEERRINQIGCMWMFISLFGSNQKRLLMDHKNGRSKRITGDNIESDVEKLIDDSVCKNSSDECLNDESEEKFSEIIKRLIAKKEGEIQTCKDLLEAFNVLGNEEESFMKKKNGSKTEEAVLVPRRKCNFFSRRRRLEERRNKSQIVVLKPSVDESLGGNKKSKNGRINFSRFLMGLIKRRLQSFVDKKSCNDVIETEKHVSDKEEDVEDSRKIMSGLYIAAKKHLSEMLANGDIDVNSPDKEVPRILGKILSLPEFSSPFESPRLVPGHDLVSTLSPLSQKKCSSSENDLIDEDKDDETLFTIDVSIPKDYDGKKTEHIDKEEKVETCIQVDEDVLEFLEEDEEEKIETCIQVESFDENILEFLEEDEEEEDNQDEMINQAHSPTSPPISSVRLIECKETVTDVLSPVSVLDPLFIDDDSSPRPTTRFSSAETRIIQPLCIRFDEADTQEPNKDNMDEKELILAYIETVVKSSGLSFEELLAIPYFSDQLLLEPELIDEELVFFPTELCDDKNLLYDCINEVLMDFSENELNPGPWIEFLKPEVRLISEQETAVKVAQEGVYWHLLPLPSPHTLDQIVSKDMAKTGSWMDLRFEIGYVCSQTSEMILDELVEEIITSLNL